jgi:hypothetical protein
MSDKSLTIKPRFESTNENDLTFESNFAVGAKIGIDEIKLPPNHREFQTIDWQLARQPKPTIFLQGVSEKVKMLNVTVSLKPEKLRCLITGYWFRANDLDGKIAPKIS